MRSTRIRMHALGTCEDERETKALDKRTLSPLLCVGLLIGTSVASAQSTEGNADKAMDALSQMEAAQTATAAAPAPAEEPTATSTQAQEPEPVIETPAAEVSAPAAETPAPDTAPPSAPSDVSDSSESSGKIVKTEVSAEDEKPTKPWKVNAGLSQSLGAGAFVSDDFARTTAYAYSVSLSGSYKLNDLLRASVGASFDQQLSTTYADGGTTPREFYFRDIKFGLSAASLYKEEISGISLSASGSFTVPTSKSSLSTGRVTYTGAGIKLNRSFEDIGPGNISLTFSSGVSFAIGAATANIGASDAPSIFATCNDFTLSGDACQGRYPNLSHVFSNQFSTSYSFFEDYSVAAWLGFSNAFYRDISDSPLDNISYDVRSSNFAVDQTRRGDSISSGLEFGYGLTENISLALGASTVTNPFIQKGSDSSGFRFFLWDVESTASNRSSLYFNLNFSY
jgi:hypothetical protein